MVTLLIIDQINLFRTTVPLIGLYLFILNGFGSSMIDTNKRDNYDEKKLFRSCFTLHTIMPRYVNKYYDKHEKLINGDVAQCISYVLHIYQLIKLPRASGHVIDAMLVIKMFQHVYEYPLLQKPFLRLLLGLASPSQFNRRVYVYSDNS